MGTTKRWTIEIFLDEDGLGTTHAAARLDTSEDAHVHGHGTYRSPSDEASSEVGADAAVSDALSQIAMELSLRQQAALDATR